MNQTLKRLVIVLAGAFQLAVAAVAVSNGGALGLPKEALGWMTIANIFLLPLINRLDWILDTEPPPHG